MSQHLVDNTYSAAFNPDLEHLNLIQKRLFKFSRALVLGTKFLVRLRKCILVIAFRCKLNLGVSAKELSFYSQTQPFTSRGALLISAFANWCYLFVTCIFIILGFSKERSYEYHSYSL